VSRVSLLVPSRNERFLIPTLRDLLAKAAGDIEIVCVLDGCWPAEPLPDDKRLKILHRGTAMGMRQAINAAAQIATGEYLLKADAHTMWAEGYDEQLRNDYLEGDWILIPRRYPLDPDKWAIEERADSKYPIDYHALSEPFGKHGDSVPGLHGFEWRARREARKHILIDDELASQGSAWFTSRAHWNRIGPLDQSRFGTFWFENLEMSMKTWLTGGRQMVTKNTWYAHLYKGARYGRGYSTRDMGHENAVAFTSWFYMTDQPFMGKVRTFRSLIEEFLPMPTWGDSDAIFARAHKEFRNPYVVAA
jgi:glycosyltransferase involved in cell wall biosynthesis